MIANVAAALLLAASIVPAQGDHDAAVDDGLPDVGQPLIFEAYTADLLAAEYDNGQLPAEALVAMESSAGCVLEREASEAWRLLEARAVEDGIHIVARWCYRDLATQRRTYRRNCPRTHVVESSTNEADGGPAQIAAVATGPRVCTVPTSKPGNSNHGWGRAIDVKTSGRLLSCQSAAFQWLQDNAADFGWVHPEWAACGQPKEEAWHWEWGGTTERPPTKPSRNIPF